MTGTALIPLIDKGYTLRECLNVQARVMAELVMEGMPDCLPMTLLVHAGVWNFAVDASEGPVD